MSHSVLKNNLISKINEKKAVIGIIGLGYVGLPLVVSYLKENYHVIGFDIDAKKIKALNAGKSYIQHVSSRIIKEGLSKKQVVFTSQKKNMKRADALIICLPTPLSKHREPDLSYVIGTVEALLPFLRKGQVLSLESTTYPGTTEEEIKSRIQRKNFQIGKDFFLVYSPEREDPGNKSYQTANIPKICGGITKSCLEVGKALYRFIVSEVIKVSDTRTAEMTKLLENIHRSVNIGLVNELKIVCDSMGIDIYEVIEAAATKPFGFTPYYPGPGLGGHCIPIDPFYLTWKAREFGISTKFIELAGQVNSSMPDWVVHKVIEALNKVGKSIKGSKILILGVAYKKDVDDVRESPSIAIMEKLIKKQARVAYSDSFVPQIPKMRRYKIQMKSSAITKKTISSYDCVIIATNHSYFDYDLIRAHAKLIVDTRGVYRRSFKNLVKA